MCSVIDRINYGVGNSTLQKCNVKCHIMRGNRVARGVKRTQHDVVYQRAYSRQPSVQLHRRCIKIKRMKDY